MAARSTQQALRSIAAGWPADPFRPNLQVKTFLNSLSNHPSLTPEAVDAARALANNAFQKKYPLTPKTLKPAGMPLYYDRLIEGYDKSARGIARPWWKIFFGVW